jgi:hypothetical protein
MPATLFIGRVVQLTVPTDRNDVDIAKALLGGPQMSKVIALVNLVEVGFMKSAAFLGRPWEDRAQGLAWSSLANSPQVYQ